MLVDPAKYLSGARLRSNAKRGGRQSEAAAMRGSPAIYCGSTSAGSICRALSLGLGA